MTTETKITEAEWNKEVDEWYKQQLKDVGTITVPEIGVLLSDEPSYVGVMNQTHKLASEDLIREYAYAQGDPNPLWQDPNYARNTRYGTIIAPPTFEAFIAAPYTSRNFAQGLMSGVAHAYYKTIRAGDEFRIFDRTHECIEKSKPDKPYRLFLVRSERKYINQREEVACVGYGGSILIKTPPGKEEETREASTAGIEKRLITDEEFDKLHRLYQEEMDGVGRRGAEIRYWEDVVEGEQLKELGAGPLNIQDLCSFSPIYTNQSFGLQWYASLKRDEGTRKGGQPLRDRRDPETNAPLVRNPHIERNTNYGEAIAYGSQTEAVLVKLATNWMGDDGFLTKLDCQMRRLWIYGQILWLKGKVVRKYVEDGNYLVDLDLMAENQDGMLVMPAAATAKLYSKEHPPKPSEAY